MSNDGGNRRQTTAQIDLRFAREWWHWFFLAQTTKAAGRRVRCPAQVLWATREDEGLLGGDPPDLMRAWADDVRCSGADSGHHVAEEAPESTAAALLRFWADIAWTPAPTL